MKKIILCAGALMVGTFAFAQVSGASQAGTAASLPGAPSSANVGESVQNGNDNKVRVRQAGTSQSVLTNQNDGLGTGGNLGQIIQTGSVSSLSGELNLAELNQSGSNNISLTEQQGDQNNAITNQGQNDLESADNKARIQQGDGNLAESNFAAIDQDGTGNEATTYQTYDNNDAWTKQVGEENLSYIRQNGGPDGSTGHIAQVDQEGDGNLSLVNQSGQGGRNQAYTRQLGDNNVASQTQNTIAMSGGEGEGAMINQGDSALFANVGATLNNPQNNGNLYSALQGLDDISNGPLNAGSTSGIAFQIQTGKMSEAEIHQFGDGTASNYAEQRQEGWDQDALIVQNAYGSVTSGNNYAKQHQRDDNNDAAISQSGADHKAYQFQDGKRNLALSTQRGNGGNKVNTYQFGNDNKVTTAQKGIDNRALVVQRSGQSYVVEQNLAGGFSQGGNQADIMQLGPNGNFATDGMNCMFMDELTPGTTPDISLEIGDICPDC